LRKSVGRGRFFLVSEIIRFFGPKARPFLEKNFELAKFLLLILFIEGFAAIKFLKH
jgi:hypothetical protein